MGLSQPARLLFLILTLALFKSNSTYAQKKLIATIDSFCKQVDLDTTIKWKTIDKDVIQKNNLCVCNDMTYHSRNDTVFKVTSYVLHIAISSSEYYFKDRKLTLVISTKRHDGKSINQTKYYFTNDKLLKTVVLVGNKPKDNKESTQDILKNAQTYIKFLLVNEE